MLAVLGSRYTLPDQLQRLCNGTQRVSQQIASLDRERRVSTIVPCGANERSHRPGCANVLVIPNIGPIQPTGKDLRPSPSR